MVGKVESEILEMIPVSLVSDVFRVLILNQLEPSTSIPISVIIQLEVAIEISMQLVPLLVKIEGSHSVLTYVDVRYNIQ